MTWLDKLKKMKKISKKTSQQIAEETSIPKSTIDKLFSGKTKEPYLNTMRLIVHAMGFTLDDLEEPHSNAIESKDISKERLLSGYDSLNEYGKQQLLEYLEMLTCSEKYTEELVQNKKRA